MSSRKREMGQREGRQGQVDLLALLFYSDWQREFLKALAGSFDPRMELLGALAGTVKKSRVEYTYLDAGYEHEGRKLRDTVGRLLLETHGRAELK